VTCANIEEPKSPSDPTQPQIAHDISSLNDKGRCHSQRAFEIGTGIFVCTVGYSERTPMAFRKVSELAARITAL